MHVVVVSVWSDSGQGSCRGEVVGCHWAVRVVRSHVCLCHHSISTDNYHI